MNQKKVIVFDMDGTLVDSKKLYIDTIHHSLLEHYFIYPKSHISQALGPKLEITLKKIARFSPKILKKLKDKINSSVAKKAASLRLAPYAIETLKKLKRKGCKIILLTNSSGRFVSTIFRHHKLSGYFNKIFYAENFSTKENAIRAIAREYKIKAKEVIYVADKVSDVKIAKNAGCRIFIVLAKSWDKDKLKKKIYSIASLKQLIKRI